MTDVKLGMMLGLASHSQVVIDDLWGQAQQALDLSAEHLNGVVVYVDDGNQDVVPPSKSVRLVSLRLKPQGMLSIWAEKLSTKPSVLGILGRLLKDNAYSRRVAKALATHTEGRVLLSDMHIIVSADTAADRAVWELRKQSKAQLMHGPLAMTRAMRKTATRGGSQEEFMAETADVDIVIAVHQLSRPIERAVRSALAAGSPGQVRVIVVAHGLEVEDVWGILGNCSREHVRVMKHTDGISSAAGPFNAGLKVATAEFVGVMGSDDLLAPKAISSWVSQARQNDADVIIAPLRFQSGGVVRTPRLRAIRRRRLDPIRDRLAYRTAPLGIIRHSTVVEQELQFTEGMATGEDVLISLRLWFGESRIAMGHSGNSYIIGEDARDRVTHQILPLETEFAPLFGTVHDPWFKQLGNAEKCSIAVKFVRIHVIPAVTRRGATWDWGGPDGLAVQRLLADLGNAAQKYRDPLSKAERSLLEILENLPAQEIRLSEGLENYAVASRADKLLTRKFSGNLLAESTVRYFLDLKVAHGLSRLLPKHVS